MSMGAQLVGSQMIDASDATSQCTKSKEHMAVRNKAVRDYQKLLGTGGVSDLELILNSIVATYHNVVTY